MCQRVFAETNHLSRGRFLEAALVQPPFEEGASMRKNSKRIPPALKHGIYSAIGLLPTEDPAEFEKFKQEIFDDYRPSIGEDHRGRDRLLAMAPPAFIHVRHSRARAGTAERNVFQIGFALMVSPASRFRTWARIAKPRGIGSFAQKCEERSLNRIGPSHRVGGDWRCCHHRVLG